MGSYYASRNESRYVVPKDVILAIIEELTEGVKLKELGLEKGPALRVDFITSRGYVKQLVYNKMLQLPPTSNQRAIFTDMGINILQGEDCADAIAAIYSQKFDSKLEENTKLSSPDFINTKNYE